MPKTPTMPKTPPVDVGKDNVNEDKEKKKEFTSIVEGIINLTENNVPCGDLLKWLCSEKSWDLFDIFSDFGDLPPSLL